MNVLVRLPTLNEFQLSFHDARCDLKGPSHQEDLDVIQQIECKPYGKKQRAVGGGTEG